MQRVISTDADVFLGSAPYTVAFGHINEWGSNSMAEVKTNCVLYIGRADSTVRAHLNPLGNGTVSVQRMWLTWEEGEGEGTQLSFNWIADDVHTHSALPAWWLRGEQVQLSDIPLYAFKEVRMHLAGAKALTALAIRNDLLCKRLHMVEHRDNSPTLWVPKNSNCKVDGEVLESFLRHILSGAGGLDSPAYHQVKDITKEAYGLSPWTMFQETSYTNRLMMMDIGRKQGVLGKIVKVLQRVIQNPLEMLGVCSKLAKYWLGQQLAAFQQCVPWWCESSTDAYVVPKLADCFVTARRVDTIYEWSFRHIPAKELGFKGCYKQHRITVQPQLPPATVIVEVKPNACPSTTS